MEEKWQAEEGAGMTTYLLGDHSLQELGKHWRGIPRKPLPQVLLYKARLKTAKEEGGQVFSSKSEGRQRWNKAEGIPSSSLLLGHCPLVCWKRRSWKVSPRIPTPICLSKNILAFMGMAIMTLGKTSHRLSCFIYEGNVLHKHCCTFQMWSHDLCCCISSCYQTAEHF